MTTRLLVYVCVLAALSGEAVHAQSKDAVPAEQTAARAQHAAAEQLRQAERQAERQADRQRARAGAYDAGALRSLSFRNFVRGGIQTGNLVQVPYVTNVNVSAGYFGGTVSPNKITWPKGSGVEYGHTMSFIVAGEVLNDRGDTLRIVSESYNRGGGDRHPTGSHQYFFNALPGYYNMKGDPATKNRLNDNADDRQTLQRTGFYFVGGISEDRNGNGRLDAGEDLNRNGQLDLELVNEVEYPAQSNLPQTWPAFWPPQSYPGDDRQPGDARPGVRAGRWNGAYGAYVRADQESYYLADDRDNDEFAYYPFIDPATGQPDRRPWADGGRRGLGVEVKVRQYQWASVLAEDIFIATFDVENVSRKDIPRAAIAMIVDYDIAGQTGDNQALFDTQDDITYQWLKRDLTINGFKVGYAGVGFLESPGIDTDGRDNDEDGMIDESRENGIDDDGDWTPGVDVNGNGRYDDEDRNRNCLLDPGEDADGDGRLTIEPLNDDVGSDGLAPCDDGYPGPDPNGSEGNGRPDLGEPNFEFTDNDEIDQIGLTSMVIRTPSDFDRDIDDDALFWKEYLKPGGFILPTETADVIYVYSSAYVAIPRGQTQRFSLAFFCGNDFQDMLRNKRTMQNIYDADYSFARPPRTPFLTAVPGDGRVTLVWDQSAELSRDPIYGFDFEMYKVYRSTDPEFNDVKTITDAFGNPLLWEPLLTPTGGRVQFDLKNGLSGAHPVPVGSFGIAYDMGTDSGLKYSYVDSTVNNGRTYYYCVVSVDRGYHGSFFERGISPYESLAEISPTESSKIIEVDAFDRPTNVDRNCAVVVPQAPALGYVAPHLADGGVRHASGDATGGLRVDFLVPDEANAKGYEYAFTFKDDGAFAAIDSTLLRGGRTTGFVLRNLTTGDTLAVSDAREAGPGLFESSLLTATLYDGMRFTITNPVGPAPTRTAWLDNRGAARDLLRPQASVRVAAPAESHAAVPADYELRVGDRIGVDTSNSLGVTTRLPTNFSLYDVTDLNLPRRAPFQFTEGGPLVPADTVKGMLSPGDVVNARVRAVNFGGYRYYAKSTWQFTLGLSPQADAYMKAARLDANALYDSLAVHGVRGFGRRPFGPDLEVPELDDFFRRLNPWYEGRLDSLANVGGLRPLLAAMSLPAVYLDAFDRIARNEMPRPGDVFVLETSKPFDRDDVLRFTVDGNRLEADRLAAGALDNVYVVPDPYVAVNSLEPRNILLSGRGERRIDFRNLPQACTIRIFTISGRLVKEIRHAGSVSESIASWNLQSEDGLDVAFGVYIYHVEAPGIGEKIGRFSIIK